MASEVAKSCTFWNEFIRLAGEVLAHLGSESIRRHSVNFSQVVEDRLSSYCTSLVQPVHIEWWIMKFR
jgi:hypothetical protein